MTDENHNVGLAPYAETSKSPARAVLARLETMSRLKQELAAVQEQLKAMVPALSGAELHELQQLVSRTDNAADADVAALKAQVAEERKLAKTQRAMSIRLSRKVSALIGAEAEKRILRGAFSSAESLVGEAVQLAYGGRS